MHACMRTRRGGKAKDGWWARGMGGRGTHQQVCVCVRASAGGLVDEGGLSARGRLRALLPGARRGVAGARGGMHECTRAEGTYTCLCAKGCVHFQRWHPVVFLLSIKATDCRWAGG